METIQALPTRTLAAALCSVAVLLACGVTILAQSYDPLLQYTRRDDHYEGLRALPISGRVQLISARLAGEGGSQPSQSTPAISRAAWRDRAVLRFYLPSADDVSVTVRQLRSESTYYVLDRVSATWKPGTVNEYTWSTAAVLRKLSDLEPGYLGAVVHLGPGKDTSKERVLPVALFLDTVTAGVKAYRFSFKTSGAARVEATILQGTVRVGHRAANREEAGSPFSVPWAPSESMREGWYRVLLKGQFDDGLALDKEVEFYHRPAFFFGGGAR